MVSLCAKSYELDQPFKNQTNTLKNGVHLSGIQMVGLSGFQNGIQIPDYLASNLFLTILIPNY